MMNLETTQTAANIASLYRGGNPVRDRAYSPPTQAADPAPAQTRPAVQSRIDSGPDAIVELGSRAPHKHFRDQPQAPKTQGYDTRSAEAARDLARSRKVLDRSPEQTEPTPAPKPFIIKPEFKGDLETRPLGSDKPILEGIVVDASPVEIRALLDSYFSGNSLEYFRIYRQLTLAA